MSDFPNTNPKEEYKSMNVDAPVLLKDQGDSNHSTPSITIEDTTSSKKRTADQLFGDSRHINFKELELPCKRQKVEEENNLIEKNINEISELGETSGRSKRNTSSYEVKDLQRDIRRQYKPRDCYDVPVLAKERPRAGGRPAERAPSKRHRVDGSQVPRRETKRGQTDRKHKRPVSNVNKSKLHLRVAVTTDPQSNLTAEQVEQLKQSIEDRIIDAVLTSVPDESIPLTFRGRPFYMDGVLAMWCENAISLFWLKHIVASMQSPIPNTKLAVIRQSKLKMKLKAGILLHSSITDAAMMQKILRAQNPYYNVNSWSWYSISLADDPRAPLSDIKVVHIVVGIPENQKESILARNRRIAYLTGSSYIRFYSKNQRHSIQNTFSRMPKKYRQINKDEQ